jgi:hypothetical protein
MFNQFVINIQDRSSGDPWSISTKSEKLEKTVVIKKRQHRQ